MIKLYNIYMQLILRRQLKTKTKLLEQIVQIKTNIYQILEHSTFEAMCQAYKRTFRHLMYFIKHRRYFNTERKFDQTLKQCMKAVMTLLYSTQFEKCCHIFPVYCLMLEKYKELTKGDFEQGRLLNQQKLYSRIDENQKSPFYVGMVKDIMTSREIDFCHNKTKINQFMLDLFNRQVVLQNVQCVCCAQVFIEDFEIKNANPILSTVKGISSLNKLKDKTILTKYFNEICNRGAGVAIFGAKTQNGALRAVGISFKNEEEVNSMENQILAYIRMLRPQCLYEFERVLVHTNFMENKNVEQEFLRICLRVQVMPTDQRKITMVQSPNKRTRNYSEAYILDKNFSKHLRQQEQLYKLMHSKYTSRNSYLKPSCHPYINCLRPHPYYSKIFLIKNKNNELSQSQLNKFQDISVNLVHQQQKINITLPNVSLLLTAANYEQINFNQLRKAFKENHEDAEISIPFSKSKWVCQKSIFLIQHEKTHKQIKYVINRFKEDKKVHFETYTMIPVYTILQVSQSKFTNSLLKQLESELSQGKPEQKFFQVIRNQGLDSKKSHSSTQIVLLKFTTIVKAIKAYIVLESYKLKTHFVDPGESHK